MFAPGQNQLLANLSLLLFFKDLSIVRFYDFKKNFRGMCFTVQLSKIGFALPFVLNSFAIISCRSLPVKNFFQLFFRSCFCFSLAATLISYHIQPAVVKNFFHFFFTALCQTQLAYIITSLFRCQELFFISFHQRRRRDLNLILWIRRICHPDVLLRTDQTECDKTLPSVHGRKSGSSVSVPLWIRYPGSL